MTRPSTRSLPLLAAAAALLLGATSAQACRCVPTRDEVRAELAEARAAGRLDAAGEAGATPAVLAAREQANATEAQVIAARRALEREILARADGDAMPDLASYIEQGREGPVLVLLIFDPRGALHSSDTLAFASNDRTGEP